MPSAAEEVLTHGERVDRLTRALLMDGCTYGSVYKTDWLRRRAGLYLDKAVPMKPAEVDACNLSWLAVWDEARALFRTEHKMEFRSVGSGSYEVVQPRDQARVALDDMDVSLRKAARKAVSSIVNTNTDLLSEHESRSHADSLEYARDMQRFLRRQLKKRPG